jgi:outer membrane protein assembly factor BamB
MKSIFSLSLMVALATVVRAEVAPAPATSTPPSPPLQITPQTTVPKGDYAVARLELPAGLNGQAHPLFLGFRDGKLANFWFVTGQDGDKRLHLEESTVARQGVAVTGKVHIRSACVSASLTLDLKVDGDKVTGTYDLDMTGTAYKSGKGEVTGTWQTQGDPLASTAAWANFWGPNLDMSSQPQPKLVEDFAQAKPVWRSEAHVLTGYGNAPDSRYMGRALSTGNGGGGSSPVVADGTVYIYFYQPSQQSPPETEGNPYWTHNFKDFQAQMEAAKANEREKNWALNHVRPLADDVVVAIDAATGATKWSTVLPLRSPNVQTHKNRAPSPVPLVVGDTVYVPNIESRLYALDRATGQLKWESPAKFDPAAKRNYKNAGPANPSPMLLGGTLLWAGNGLDPATGQEKWKMPSAFQSYLVRWTQNGKDRVLGIQWYEGQVLCLDPADGNQVWKQSLGLMASAPADAVVSGDILVAVPKGEKSAKPQVAGFKITETGLTELWRDQPIQNDENLPITVADGKAYLLGAGLIRILDIATGKQVSELKGGEYALGSNPWMGVIGDRFLLIPEGQHGTASYIFLDRDLKNLGPLWRPNHTPTTAYNSQPMIAPVVDGRVFLRGGDGIYCYDLRAASKPNEDGRAALK